MFGQGSPFTSPGMHDHAPANRRVLLRLRAAALGFCANSLALIWLLLGASLLQAQGNAASTDQLELELRLALGGGAAQQWQGTISVTQGAVSFVRGLGLEPDSPGSVQAFNQQLRFSQRSPRTYDGFDITVRAPRDAQLVVEIKSSAGPRRIEIPLLDVLAGDHSSAIDEQQNRLLIRRTPGDRLRVGLERDALVFDTGETFRFSVTPHEAGLPSDTALKCRVRLLGAGDLEAWSGEADFRIDRSGAPPVLGPFEFVVPEQEGVYRAVVEITQPPRLGVALVRTKPLLTRELQFVAIAPTHIPDAVKPFETLVEIDPAHPGWLDRLKRFSKLASIPGFAQEPLGNGKAMNAPHLETSLVKLATSGWQAYPLPIRTTGQPHILEVEYPSDLAQDLGISIVEPNAAGQIMPLGVDSGVHVSELLDPASGKLVKHRLVFWPRTKTPLVLLSNRHARHDAWFGKLRVLHGPTELPRHTTAAPTETPARLLAAYYDKPIFAENFNASEALDPASGRTLDDWHTFYQGAKRLIEELKYAGYNGAILSVACEGSTIYPSQLLEPTPKYDMGTFFASGQDPLRKDVLEMLFRMFNREGLQLVPAVQFSSPLVELEALRQRDPDTLGLDLIGADGKPWLVSKGTRRGLAPYYNPLDERVRVAMRHVIDEITERYAHHAAFAGVSLQLSPETYAQLPGEDWGFDERTTERFSRDTQRPLASTAPARFAQRARQLQTTEREAWLAWRGTQVASLYTTIQRDLVRRRGSAKLYLAGGEMFHSETLLKSMRPTLPAQANARQALLAVGIDPRLLQDETNIVFLRPQRQFAPSLLATQGGHRELNRVRELDDLFENANATGVHLFHEPATLRLPEFDAASPFGKANTHLFMAAQLLPSGEQNRRRFAQALAATDAHSLVDGGWSLPLGQEDAVRDLFSIFRELPPLRFTTIEPTGANAQPVICRRAVDRGATYLYLVNNSPYPVSVKLELRDPDRGAIRPLGNGTAWDPPTYEGDVGTVLLELQPYDLRALQCASPRVHVAGWQCTLPPAVIENLHQQINQLRARAVSLRGVKSLDHLANPGFETVGKEDEIPGWVHASDEGLAFALDRVDARGKHALRIRSNGPVAWIRSEPFAPPTTGRISVWVWLKVKDPQQQPTLRLAIEGKHRGETYYRFASVGAGHDVPALRGDWAPYLFQIDDLPTTDLTDLRVGFDLMDANDIWIDDVQVFDLYFHDHEQNELVKIIATADLQLSKGRITDCQRVLEGYWPRFLNEHVPLDPARLTAASKPEEAPAEPAATEPAASTSMRDRLWYWVPKWR